MVTSVDNLTVFNYHFNRSSVPYVFQRITPDDNQVCQLTFFDCSQVICLPEVIGSHFGCGHDRPHGAQPRRNQQLKLSMKANSGNYGRPCIRAGDHVTSCLNYLTEKFLQTPMPFSQLVLREETVNRITT